MIMIRKKLLGIGMGVAMILANAGSANAFDLRFASAFKTIIVHERVETFEIRRGLADKAGIAVFFAALVKESTIAGTPCELGTRALSR